jgi:hypothetical protein
MTASIKLSALDTRSLKVVDSALVFDEGEKWQTVNHRAHRGRSQQMSFSLVSAQQRSSMGYRSLITRPTGRRRAVRMARRFALPSFLRDRR